ncbi:MAG: homocysteine S-methyltransferase [Planctomycetes bacterium]|nr:homocysteine S-methyltransferase [Planctomycetota bacterium]
MNPITPFLDKHNIVILDGALATDLERRGADLRDPLWSAKLLLEDPALIRQVHHDYFAAGADVATTASYQATLPGLMKRGLTHVQSADVLRRSVTLAQQARDEFWQVETSRRGRLKPLVAASIGCYGAFLHDGSEYRGDYGLSVQQLIDWHRPRLEILAGCGADLLACETIPCLVEAEALVKLLSEVPHMRAWLSFSCKDEQRICHGEPFSDGVALANDAVHIVAVGVNCTAPRFIEGLLASATSLAHKPLLAYPNSGETWDAARHCWHGDATDSDWRDAAQRWHRAGARLIGGCCRTTPATIRQIAQALRPS